MRKPEFRLSPRHLDKLQQLELMASYKSQELLAVACALLVECRRLNDVQKLDLVEEFGLSCWDSNLTVMVEYRQMVNVDTADEAAKQKKMNVLTRQNKPGNSAKAADSVESTHYKCRLELDLHDIQPLVLKV